MNKQFLLSTLLLVVTGFSGLVSEANEGIGNSASARSVELTTILKISNEIDRLVEKQLQSKSQQRNPLANDEIFVRRAYLDIIGRIPDLDETKAFLNSDSDNKREELIDDLLDSYGYVSRQFNYWADVLRLKTRVRNVIGQPYIDYVKDSLAENKPYDEFVREMLSASGPMLQRSNGAVGYYLRDENMPEDNMSNTVRIFLGTRLECAQCHDHPFDKWTQRQYFEMVAFTGGMRFRTDTSLNARLRQLARDQKVEIDQEKRAVLRRMIQPLTYGVAGSGTGLARLPEGFMGADGDEGDIIPARTMFESDLNVDPKVPPTRKNAKNRKPKNNRNQQVIPGAMPIDTRLEYANWMVDSDNPRFAKVIANRLWKQTMGIGLIEPVDVIEDSTDASNPELMEYLADTMVELDFDLKQFLRAIYNTRTYQSCAVGTDVNELSEFNFNGPIMRRMSAEQIWDSLVTLAVPDVDERAIPDSSRYLRYIQGDDIYDAIDKLQSMTAEDFLELANRIVSKDKGMAMMSNQKKKDRQKGQQLREEVTRISRKIQQAKRAKNTKLQKKLMLERTELVASFKKSRRDNGFRRASELQSPAPNGHFLREFGQSDREQIENANTDPAVTQVLSLMNGYIESQISSNQTTVLVSNVVKADSTSEKVEAIFLTMLSRKPNAKEINQWSEDFEKYQFEAVSDLIWILANSNEFIFVK